jgi:hypothetical protein
MEELREKKEKKYQKNLHIEIERNARDNRST